MKYTKLNSQHIEALQCLLGANVLYIDSDTLVSYSHDETENLSFLPEIVAKPKNVNQVSLLLSYCNKNQIPITPRGAGTGLCGGALPVMGGILVSMEYFNKIIDIDTQNLQATVESGLITQVLMDEVEKHGLLYPIDPSSKGSCFIGGNVAHGSGGPRVIKYGTLRDYILNLEVVLADGSVIWTGANTLKYASGYNITQLFIGSEGTLGIITKVVVKLISKPEKSVLMLASFETNELACGAVSAIFRAGVTPSALEFMERVGVDWVMKYDNLYLDVPTHAKAFLLIEIEGNHEAMIMQDCEKINHVLEKFEVLDILFADAHEQKESLWKVRRTMAVSVKSNSVYKEEDVVVPRANLPILIKGIKDIGEKYGFQSVVYGHSGDGNLHVNIIKGDMSEEKWNKELPNGIKEIFKLSIKLGGTISGEHGIGWVQKEYMELKYTPLHLELMRGIKRAFDPNSIINPNKIF